MPFHPTRRHLIALSGAALWMGRAQAETAALQQIEGQAFASHWRVAAPAAAPLAAQRPALEALLARVDQQMSPWRADSDVTRFNLAAAECAVPAELALVARAALDIARDSGGAFDPTVGPLVARWGFGAISGAEAGRWQGLRAGEAVLAKDAPGLTLDLCGIAKGYALDLMAAHLAAAGIGDFLIDLGGELKSAGHHPSGRAWQVAVEDPRPGAEGLAAGLALPDGLAVATSGLRAQSYALPGHAYGHIIDPHRGTPVDGALASVSVLAPTGMSADGWATALVAAGADGPALARARGLSALFLRLEGGALVPETTGDFATHLL